MARCKAREVEGMSKIRTHYVVVSDDAPDEVVREAVRRKAKMLEADVNMNDIKVVRESELRQGSSQPDNTPLNADEELRKAELREAVNAKLKRAYELASAAVETEEQRKGIEFFYHVHLNSYPGVLDSRLMQLITADRERVALQARLSEGIYWQTSINDKTTGAERLSEVKQELEKL